MIHLLLLYGANLGEIKGLGKGNVEKKHGVSVARFKGHHHYRWRVNFREGGKLRRLGFKTKAVAIRTCHRPAIATSAPRSIPHLS